MAPILGCSVVGALVVGVDTWYSAQEGYLGRGPDYEGIGYLQIARTAYLLIRGFHLKGALGELNSITPLWTYLQTLQYFVVGDGTWQAFTVRFWPVALLLILVYWIVRARASRGIAIAAVALTAILPMVSASVRASSWEFFSGQANYFENWGLDDLRPDFLAAVLILWSIAALGEHHRAPHRSAYVVSAAFAAAAVLTKPSTAAFALAAWAATLSLMWLWNRGAATLRMTALSGSVLILLLTPWAIVGGGLKAALSRLYAASVTYSGAYSAGGDLLQKSTYYLERLPSQIGQVEIAVLLIATPFVAAAMLRRQLDNAEATYAGIAAFFYVAFSIPSNKDPNIAEYVSLPLWIFFIASATRLWASTRPALIRRASPAVLAAVGLYVLSAYAIGLVALANWPANERASNAQLRTVTLEVADELARHLSSGDCFAYAPGPGWPASIQYLLMDSRGRAPASTTIDVAPSTTTVEDYVLSAQRCKAVIVYRQEMAEVARVFFAPAVRRPYLQAVADWVQRPDSGYRLDRTWALTDLAPRDQHALGHYQGISLTVELYLRSNSG